MTATIRPAARPGAWHILVIGLVAVLAAGIGMAAGAFLMQDRVAGAGGAATYVPADAPMYFEVRLEPSAEQDAALREFLGHFPTIDGLDLDRPLYDQLGEMLDEQLATEADTDLTWSADVEPWFDGRVAFAVTDIPLEAMAEPTDPMAEPALPGMLVIVGVTDAEAARAVAARLVDEAADHGADLVESEHRGVTIRSGGDVDGAYAVTDDALLVAPDAASIIAALDVQADEGAALAATQHLEDVVEHLPPDWLAFGAFDFGGIMRASLAASGEQDASVAAMRALIEHQPMRGAMVITAHGDRIAIDGTADAPTGPFAIENADRGLASEVPADALYFADGGNIGVALAAIIDAIKQAAEAEPEAAEQIRMAEAALGADLTELIDWIDDGAIAAGWGAQPWAGVVLVPTDVDAAARRLGQLSTFAGLAGLDPESGVTVSESEVAGEAVTTIRWSGPAEMQDAGIPMADGLVVEYTVTDDRAIIGIGESFVRLALELDEADSLAANPRYAETIDELGGAANAGVAWVDLAAARQAFLTAMEPMMAFADPDGEFATTVEPWLAPFDRLASVSVLEDGVVVQRAALFVE